MVKRKLLVLLKRARKRKQEKTEKGRCIEGQKEREREKQGEVEGKRACCRWVPWCDMRKRERAMQERDRGEKRETYR